MSKRFPDHGRALLWLALPLAGAPAAGQPAPVPPPIAQLHADCDRPQYASDTLVCGDPELKAADRDVAALDASPPVLADGAIWEDQAAWLRRRSLCAFAADHRACLVAAYADRQQVLRAAAAAVMLPLRCSGAWKGRAITASAAATGEPLAFRENGALLGVATAGGKNWQPALSWRAAGHNIKLKTQDGRQFNCRPAPP